MLIAIVSQDSQQLTSLVMRLGAVPPGLDEPALSVDLAEFVESLRESADRIVRPGRCADAK